MKSLTLLLLAGSLLLNAVLGVALLLPSAPATPPAAAPAPAATAAAPAAAPLEGAWGKIDTKELPDLVARLRAEGFPPDIVRAIITAQIYEHFAARRRALEPSDPGRPFWKDTTNRGQWNAAMLQISREQHAMLRQLLGADAESGDPLRDLYQNRSFAFLPAEKAVDLRQLLREFDDRRSDLYVASAGGMPDRTKMVALDKEQNEAIAALLSPEQLLEYRIRASNTGNSLRDLLSAFNPTEEEFRALFKLRESFDEKYNSQQYGLSLPSDASMRERSEAERAINAEFKTTLSPERAALFDRATDFSYRRTSQLVERLGMPAEMTDRLWQTQKQFEQRRNDIFRTATPDQRNQMLSSLQQEAVAQLTTILGQPSHVDAYKQYGGNWLQNLIPQARPTPR